MNIQNILIFDYKHLIFINIFLFSKELYKLGFLWQSYSLGLSIVPCAIYTVTSVAGDIIFFYVNLSNSFRALNRKLLFEVSQILQGLLINLILQVSPIILEMPRILPYLIIVIRANHTISPVATYSTIASLLPPSISDLIKVQILSNIITSVPLPDSMKETSWLNWINKISSGSLLSILVLFILFIITFIC